MRRSNSSSANRTEPRAGRPVGSGHPPGALICRDVLGRADERMLGLQLVAVQRSRFPVGGASNRAGQCCDQSLSGVAGATRGELDLLVDLAGQTPGLIFGPHQVRLLIAALRGSIPSQRWCVSEYLNGSGEQQHGAMRNRHPWRLRKRVPGMPALPGRRVPTRRRGRVPSEGRERCAKSRIFSSRLDIIGILGKRDAHVDLEPGWAVTNQIPPTNLSAEQPLRCVRVCGRRHLRHAFSLAQKC